MDTENIPQRASITLYSLQNGEQKELATVRLENKEISISGPDEGMVENLKKGVPHSVLHKTVTPDDGYLFLITLQSEFQSPYLFAGEIIEE